MSELGRADSNIVCEEEVGGVRHTEYGHAFEIKADLRPACVGLGYRPGP